MVFVSMTVIGLICGVPPAARIDAGYPVPVPGGQLAVPGSTPSEVERIVTRPVEEALSTLTGIQRMNSVTRADGVNIEMEFKWGQDTRRQGGRSAREDRCDPRRPAVGPDPLSGLQGFDADQPVMNLRISA
jgi:HAE1 family hydrophobic/amphiphilic exporter-1